MKSVIMVDGKVTTYFGCPQDNSDVVEIEDDDDRYLEFINASSPSASAVAVTQRDMLLQLCAARISPLQYLKDSGNGTKAEEAKLSELIEYSVSVSRIDKQKGFPHNIYWPVKPE